jgi:hypothetical protein
MSSDGNYHEEQRKSAGGKIVSGDTRDTVHIIDDIQYETFIRMRVESVERLAVRWVLCITKRNTHCQSAL